MGVFTRFKDIVGANINAILDKAENPEKMVRLMMQEMEDTMVELKSACAEKMAARKAVEREEEGLKNMLTRWEGRAKLAVAAGKDELAKEALAEKKSCLAALESLEKEIKYLDSIIGECKVNIAQLEEKLEQVSQKHRLLIQRGLHAKEKKRAQETLRFASGHEAMRRFDEMEIRINRMEAEADLAGSARNSDREWEFMKMENSSEIEEELAALKKNMANVSEKGKGK